MTIIMKSLMLLCAYCCLGLVSLPTSAAEQPAGSSKLVHVVSLKFKSTASPDQIAQVIDAFRDLKKKIPGIQTLEWGTNVSPEKHDHGFTHAFVLSFKSAEDRDAYLVHPDHKAFGKVLGPVLADVFVIDYWAQP